MDPPLLNLSVGQSPTHYVMATYELPVNLTRPRITPGLSDAQRSDLQRQNLASLDRKITYCLGRPANRLQYQPVEGWSAQQVLDHMKERGISQTRIDRSFFSGRRAG